VAEEVAVCKEVMARHQALQEALQAQQLEQVSGGSSADALCQLLGVAGCWVLTVHFPRVKPDVVRGGEQAGSGRGARWLAAAWVPLAASALPVRPCWPVLPAAKHAPARLPERW
jgi:hypothetical protein